MTHLLFLAHLVTAGSTDSTHLYRILMLRAAPGELLNVIDLYRQHLPAYDTAHQPRPFIMRHSQGDQWDLLLLFPMTVDRVTAGDETFAAQLEPHVAWREEVFVAGPPLGVVTTALCDMPTLGRSAAAALIRPYCVVVVIRDSTDWHG